MESFVSLLQKKLPNRKISAIRDELRFTIVTWIERASH